MYLTKVANAAFEQYKQANEEEQGWKPMHGAKAFAGGALTSVVPFGSIIYNNIQVDDAREEAREHGVKLKGFGSKHPGWATVGAGMVGAAAANVLSGGHPAAGFLGSAIGSGLVGYTGTR